MYNNTCRWLAGYATIRTPWVTKEQWRKVDQKNLRDETTTYETNQPHIASQG
jgi:hypothetical protein